MKENPIKSADQLGGIVDQPLGNGRGGINYGLDINKGYM
jgi:hypothetical protein